MSEMKRLCFSCQEKQFLCFNLLFFSFNCIPYHSVFQQRFIFNLALSVSVLELNLKRKTLITNKQIGLKIRIMIQKIQVKVANLNQQLRRWIFGQKNIDPMQQNPLNEVMKQPTIQQVMKSILIVLRKKQHTIQNLYTIDGHQNLAEPFNYIFKNGGKRIRLVLAILISGMYTQELKDEIIQMGALIETLHTGSLIVDDIEDQSKSRRDNPCAHLVYGVKQSINSANLMYFLPFKKIMQSNYTEQEKMRFTQIYAKEMITCHLGQAQDVYTHKIKRAEDLPTLDQYIRMTSAKTSSLFTMLIQMIAVILKIDSKNTQSLIKIMRYVGISFQITDDILNVTQNLGKQQKAEDFHQRKFSILVHHLRKNQEFMRMFFMEKKDDQTIEKMIAIVHQQKTIEYCQQIAYGYAEKALRQIEKIICPYSKSSFKAVVKYVVERNK